MANRKHLINVHTSTGTEAPTGASLYLGEIAVQHTPNEPAIWIKMGSAETSTEYEKFIGETEIVNMLEETKILGSGYTYSGLSYIDSSTTIADAFSALTNELIKDEKVTSAALNELNIKTNEITNIKRIIREDEEITAEAINALNERVDTVENHMSGEYIQITGYQIASGSTEEELALNEEDTVDEAFGKLQKQMLDNEEAIAAGLNDLNNKVDDLEEQVKQNSGVTQLSGAVRTLSAATIAGFDYLTEEINTVSAKTAGVLTLSLNGVEQGQYCPSASTTINLEAIQEITGADVLLTGYELSTGSTEQELVVLATDTVNEAFGKLQKQNYDNEAVVAGALNDLDERVEALEEDGSIEELSAATVDIESKLDILSGVVIDNELVTASALINLNDKIDELSGNTSISELSAATVSIEGGLETLSGVTEEVADGLDTLSGTVEDMSYVVATSLNDINDKINELSANTGFDGLEEITWSELKTLRDSSGLTPGMQYRITDYNTTTAQEDTQAAGHQFDIIVVADDVNKLNENARAVLHSGDTYFCNASARLESWEIKYSLDNDTKRFYWAVTGATGRGVIYYMKDEWNNECPYDFKNIQFKRKLTDGEYDTGGVETFVYTFNAYDLDNETINDASIMTGRDVIDDGTQYCFSNVIKPGYRLFTGNIEICLLNDIVFLNLFSVSNDSYFECYFNTFGNNCQSNTFGASCHSNTFGNDCSNNTLDTCGYNTFGNGCHSNFFGENCARNSFGNSCVGNSFGSNCSTNTFGDNCSTNTFGDGCSTNTFGNGCNNNTFGNGCNNNTFGNNCTSNTFEAGCYFNAFGNCCMTNRFSGDCNSNTFGNNCLSNTFGNSSYYNSFGNHCQRIIFSKDYVHNVIIENGNQYITLTSTQSPASSTPLRNITIAQGVNNSTTRKTISHDTLNDTFKTTYQSSNSQTINI